MRMFKSKITNTVSALTLIAMCFPPSVAVAAENETNTYHLKLMAQTFDGFKEFSNTQTSTVQRTRNGNESYTLLDFGDGSVVIEGKGEKLAASSFENTSGIEAEFLYNYDTKTLSGSNDSARYFNTHVRPYLNSSPALGSDALWDKTVSLNALNVRGASGGQVKISLNRDYFTHDGKDYVLLHYQVPAFAYRTASGQEVVHWGEGVTVTDPNFGEVYWNATLQRAVAEEADGSKRPYRLAKTMTATDNKGLPIFDPRKVDKTRDYFANFYGGEKMEVMGYHGSTLKPDQSPILLAANLDVMALALAENSANPVPQLSGQYLNGKTGMNVRRTANKKRQGALSRPTDGSTIFGEQGQNDPAVYPHEPAHQIQGAGGSSGSSDNENSANSTGGKSQYTLPPAQGVVSPPRHYEVTDDPDDPYADFRGPAGGKAPIKMSDFDNVSGGGTGVIGTGGTSTGSTGGDSGTGTVGVVGGPSQIDPAGSNIVDLAKLLETPSKFLTVLSAVSKDQQAAEDLLKQLNQLDAYVQKTTAGVKELAGTIKGVKAEYMEVKRAREQLEALYDAQAAGISTYEGMLKGPIVDTIKKLSDLAGREKRLLASLGSLGRESDLLRRALDGTKEIRKQLPKLLSAAEGAGSNLGRFASSITNGLKKFDSSISALGFVADASSLYTTTSNLGNFDPADTDLKLSSSYDMEGGFYTALALDLIGIAGSAKDGGIYAVASGVTAFSVGRFTDLYKAIQAAEYAEGESKLAHKRYILTMMKRTKQLEAIAAKELAKMPETGLYTGEDPYKDGYDLTNPNIDQETGLPIPGYWAHLKKSENGRNKLRRMGIDPDAPVGGWPGGMSPAQERARELDIIRRQNEINREENTQRKAAFKESFRIKYPQVDPKTIKKIRKKHPKPTILSPEMLAEIKAAQEELKKQEELDKKFKDYQANFLENKKKEEAKKEAERIQRIKDGGLDVSPIKYTVPEYHPPIYHPPVYHPPKPAPIKHSEIPFSNSDDDWTTGTKFVSNDYDAFTGSGTFNPDLSEWAEWLATQNLRELKRLARTAGYPNLAAALRDWKNLIAKANDDGFRQWAGRAPVCYMACAGLLGQWHIKSSQLALGDILNDSREIFSTAGLSDVSISGFVLRYLLRDFGLEDGDNINIVISQFGRTIFETNLSLLNAGTNFEINLRPGVASIVITALDEGAVSPNTAEIKLEDVVEGEATQTYSLLTGETATLRINPGRVGGGINQPTTNNTTPVTTKAPPIRPSMADLSRRVLTGRLSGVSNAEGLEIFQTTGTTVFIIPNPIIVRPVISGPVMQAPEQRLRTEQMRRPNKFNALKSGEIQ